MDSISDSEERKPTKQLTDARHKFDAYLGKALVAGHYLSVSSREAPLRRVDGDKVTALAQLAIIRDRFTWDDVQSRWTLNDGRRIVTEDEIYDIILSFQRQYRNTRDNLLHAIRAEVDGVQTKDITMAVDLWKEHKLGSLDMVDDTLWGGPAAVYEPRSISASADSDHSEDPMYSTPGTDFPSTTRTRNHAIRAPQIQNHRGDLVPPPRSRGRISVGGKHLSDSASRVRIPATQDLLERNPLTGQSRARQTSDNTDIERARGSTIAASTPTSPPAAANKKRRRKTIAIEPGPSGEEEYQQSSRPTKRTTVGGASLINSGSLNSIPSQMGAPNLPRMEARYGHDPQSNPFEGLSSNAIAGTSLLVSADNQQHGRAPANVPLDDCGTQEQLFETLVIECNLKGKAAAELSAVSATYTWNHKQHLIRKGRPRDWSIFCEDIRKAWTREAGRFAEDGCEIKMMVHVNA